MARAHVGQGLPERVAPCKRETELNRSGPHPRQARGKITGEFWAQITEGDGNFHMFEFLEREGAQVIVDHRHVVAYLMYQAKAHAIANAGKSPIPQPEVVRGEKAVRQLYRLHKKLWGSGWPAHVEFLLSSHESSTWADYAPPCATDGAGRIGASLLQPVRPWWRGHLEVGKNVYYTIHKLCHMVLD